MKREPLNGRRSLSEDFAAGCNVPQTSSAAEICNPLQKPDQTTTYKEQTQIMARPAPNLLLRGAGDRPIIPKPVDEEPALMTPEDGGGYRLF